MLITRPSQTLNDMFFDTSADTAQPIKCIFLVHHVEALDAVADVYFAMRRTADFEPVVLSIPRRFPGADVFAGEEDVHLGLVKLGIDHIRFDLSDKEAPADVLRLMKPDIIFRQAPWDKDIQPGFMTAKLDFAKLCYIPYAMPIIQRYSVVEGAESPDLDSYSRFLKSCWRIFCENDVTKRGFEASAASPDRVVVSGYPKFDRLREKCHGTPFWPIQNTSGQRPYRIIWAPHHSVGSDWLGFGVFVSMVKEMLEWLAVDQSVEVVLKPHPALFDKMKSMGGSQLVSTFFTYWEALPNTAIVGGGDYGSLFAASDAMITDGISFLVEYQLADKPLIFLDSQRHVPFNEIGDAVVKGTYRVFNFAECLKTIAALRAGHVDHLASARRKLVAELLLGDGQSADRILSGIRTGLRPGEQLLSRERLNAAILAAE